MNIKRQLYLYHRWSGIALCLFFAMWFFSGVVMMYVGFPKLTDEERLAALPRLPSDIEFVSPADFVRSLPKPESLETVRLSSLAGRAVYQIRSSEGWRVAYADTGEFIEQVTPELARKSAETYAEYGGFSSSNELFELGMIEIDQWSVSSSLHDHRPLYRFRMSDTDHTQLYISSTTGEVVRDVSAPEKVWNWLGANLHWIYPVQLRKHVDLWVDVVIVLSLLCFIPIITGAVVGVLRIRIRKPYKGNRNTPYRGMAKLHHILGLVVLVILVMYMFSGLMSMNPWGVFNESTSYYDQKQRYRYGPDAGQGGSAALALERANHSWQRLQSSELMEGVKEVNWHFVGGEVLWVLHRSPTDRCVVRVAARLSCRTQLFPDLEDKLGVLLPLAKVDSFELLQEYDNYYYSHHGRLRPLPAWRVKFSDEAETWFYIDAKTGELQRRVTSTGRVQRWLYNGLHSLDFSFLIQLRPLWDVVVIVLSISGFVFSVSAIVLGFRRTRVTVSHRRRPAR